MNKTKHLASLTNLLVVFLLLASIVCSNFGFSENTHAGHVTTITKKSDSSSTTYAHLLCEEKEKEEEGISRHNAAGNLVLIYQICDLFSSTFPETEFTVSYNSPDHSGDAPSVPIYLSKRSFLI
jgi:hypothetical protein